MQPRLSIVVPIYNEEENVPLLVEAVRDALTSEPDWQLVLVDDGSTDASRTRMLEAAARDPHVRPVFLARNYGQSTAMQAGFDASDGDVVVTMDGDLQNDPRDIPELVRTLLEGGYDLVAGYRQRRQDKLLTRKVPSWIANRIIARVTGVPIRDNGCSLKAYRSELLDRVRLYSDMHRFIPALAAGTAGARIKELPVRHHPRRLGESKYGLTRIFKVMADLITIHVLRSFRLRPLVLFGGASLATFAAAASFALLAFTPMASGAEGQPSFVFIGSAVALLALAAFLLMAGLIAEMVVEERGKEGEPDLLAREVLP